MSLFEKITRPIESIQSWLARGRPAKGRIIIFCGAGLSAPSGLGVYRGPSGTWTLSPQAREAMDFHNWPASRAEALAHLAQWRHEALRCSPNAAHLRIASWKKAWPESVSIITQNVDGLFQRAGLSDSDVIEVHGSLHRMRCADCQHEWPLAEGCDNGLPCPACQSLLTKPSVVFFNEPAPLYSKMADICSPSDRLPSDTLISIGTSWQVISPAQIFGTRGRAMGQQLSIDIREQPELSPWIHASFAGGAIEGTRWAEKKIYQAWRNA